MKTKKFTRNKQQKIDKIVDATLVLLEEKGYENLSTNHIAEHAKIGIGTIYRNFPDGKPDIMLYLLKNNIDQFIDVQVLENLSDTNFTSKVYAFVESHVKLHRENRVINLAVEHYKLSHYHQLKDFILGYLSDKFNLIAEKMQLLDKFASHTTLELKAKLLWVFNLVEAITHRHVFFLPFCEDDKQLIQYLTQLVLTTFDINE